jgi:hypothetical protein
MQGRGEAISYIVARFQMRLYPDEGEEEARQLLKLRGQEISL